MTEVVTAGRSALPSTDYDTVWLADLIKATKAVAASPERCDPAIVKAFSDRLPVPTNALNCAGPPWRIRFGTTAQTKPSYLLAEFNTHKGVENA
jgi:hypothetical protein